jgi:hypothetical protein
MSSVRSAIENAAAGEVKSEAESALINTVKQQAAAGNLEVAAGVLLVGGIVAGVCYTGLKWHQHEAAEHLRQVNIVEANAHTYFKRIPVSKHTTLDMSDPFDRDEKTGLLHARKDYKTIPELRAMVHGRSSEGFSPKADDAISRFLSKVLEFYEDRLKRFWLWRGSEGDATSAYLRYIICRGDEFAKKFQGTDYTKNILIAFHDSLNDFSIQHGDKSERRTYLDLACRSLKKGIKALEQQKKDRTLGDLIDDATPECDDLGRRLLSNLTKLVTPKKHYEHIDRCFDPELIAEGYIKKETAHGKPGTHPGAIHLNTSPVGQNLQKLALHYNEAKGLVEAKDEKAAADIQLKTTNFTPEEKAQNLAIFTEKDKILGISRGLRTSNFMTTTSRLSKPNSESGETVLLDPEKQLALILERLEGYHALALLNNDDILIMKLFYKLKRYAKDKGDEFVANPANAHFMFDVLLALGKAVRKDANKCEEKLAAIEEDHEFKTLDPEQAHLLLDTQQLVKSIREEVESSIKEIENYRTEAHYELLEKKIHLEDHETLQYFAQIAQEKGLILPQEIVPQPSLTALTANVKKIIAPSSSVPAALSSSAVITTEMKGAESKAPRVLKPRPPKRQLEEKEISLDDLDTVLTEIEAQITKNGRKDFKRPYERLHKALLTLRNDYFAMHGEVDADRKLKADKTKDLTYMLCLLTQNFLLQPIEQRHSDAADFAIGIQKMINQPQNGFMDVHFGRLDVYIDEHKDSFLGWFERKSTTHGHFAEVIKASLALAEKLKPRVAVAHRVAAPTS